VSKKGHFGTDVTDGHGYCLSFLKKSGTRFLETGGPPGAVFQTTDDERPDDRGRMADDGSLEPQRSDDRRRKTGGQRTEFRGQDLQRSEVSSSEGSSIRRSFISN